MMEETMSEKSVEDAILVLNDTHQPGYERIEAAHMLASHLEPRCLESLIHAAEDDDPGVRWAAARELAAMGEPALTPLLHALMQHPGSSILRTSVQYVIRHNKSEAILNRVAHFQQAWQGPAADLTAMLAAYNLLLELKNAKPAH
jgi:HEAT repeat protein